MAMANVYQLTLLGLTNSFGSFQSLYTETILNEYPVSVVAWIGSVQVRISIGRKE